MMKTRGRIRKANVAILLRLISTPHRNRLVGIFNRIGPSDDWNVRLLRTEAELRDILRGDGWAADGIITFMPREAETADAIAASRIPLVGIGIDEKLLRRRTERIATVSNDNGAVASLAADYLARLGNFREFAFVYDAANRPWSHVRGAAFAKALAARGRTCRIYRGTADPADEDAALGAFLDSLEHPAAVLASHDLRALDILRIARDRGISVPGRISVLGIDDDELLCEHAIPALSSVRTDSQAMGAAAADCLMKLMHGARRTKPLNVRIPVAGVVERESTRPLTPAAHIIKRAQVFIKGSIKERITPDDVARHLGISRRLLDLRFRQYAGMTVTDTINAARLTEAKRLLRQSKLSVHAALSAAGFNDLSYAHRLFKRTTGLSPLAFRRHRTA